MFSSFVIYLAKKIVKEGWHILIKRQKQIQINVADLIWKMLATYSVGKAALTIQFINKVNFLNYILCNWGEQANTVKFIN